MSVAAVHGPRGHHVVPRGVARAFVVAATLVVVLGVALPAGASTLVWTPSTIPWSAPGPAPLESPIDVSCASTTMCLAVKLYYSGPDVDVYNGTSWTSEVVPVPATAEDPVVESVSCSSTTMSCAAVGYATLASANGEISLEGLVDTFAGGSWSSQIVSAPQPWTSFVLSSVSCTSTCDALGLLTNDTAQTDATGMVVEAGTSWTVKALGGINASYPGELSDIVCTSASWCAATGALGTSPGLLAETYDGSSWSGSVLDLSGTVFQGEALGTGVPMSCSAEASCLGVLRSNEGTVAVTLAGDTWSADPVSVDGVAVTAEPSCVPGVTLDCLSAGDNPSTSNLVAEVDNGGTWDASTIASGEAGTVITSDSCVTVTSCVAVGVASDGSPLAAVGSGSAWSVGPLPTFAGPSASFGSSISCTSSSACTVLGIGWNASNAAENIAATLQTDGWDVGVVPGPAVDPVTLSSVSCTTDCVMVGSRYLGLHRSAPYAVTSSGTSWTDVQLSLPSGFSSGGLTSVSCTSVHLCVAVGSLENASGSTAFVATDRSGTWTEATLARVDGTSHDALVSVSCPSKNVCVAVGSAMGRTTSHGYVETLTGGRWHDRVLSAPAHYSSESMTAVSCATVSSCAATVQLTKPGTNGLSTPGLQSWNGSTWSRAVALAVGQGAALASISCPSRTSCVAVGEREDVHATAGLVVEQTSSGWSTEMMPPAGNGPERELTSVSCWAPGECRAIGTGSSGNSDLVIFAYVSGAPATP